MGCPRHRLQPHRTEHARLDAVHATGDWLDLGADLSASPGIEWSILPGERGQLCTQTVCGNRDGHSLIHPYGSGRNGCTVGNTPVDCTDGFDISPWAGTGTE